MLSGLTVWIISWRYADFRLPLHFFNLFEVLFNYIILFYIYTWILVIKSVLLMSLDVGNSRILTMRGLTKTRTKAKLTPTAFRLVLSAGKLNLPLVPSQDYDLQDNKRFYDKILSDWNFRLPSLGFKCIQVGLNEHD